MNLEYSIFIPKRKFETKAKKKNRFQNTWKNSKRILISLQYFVITAMLHLPHHCWHFEPTQSICYLIYPHSALFARCLPIWCAVWPNMAIGVDPRGLTFQSEFLILGSLQGARNKFFHENHCADFLFTDGTAHPVSGAETKRFYLIFS